MTTSEYIENKARKDTRFMRFLKELNLRGLYFKCIKLHPQTTDTTKSALNTRSNLVLLAFNNTHNEEFNKAFPDTYIRWGHIDAWWYKKGVYVRKAKNILKITNQIKKELNKAL